ncbi:hypothetical protein MLD38_006173 [Melastoma candidum]|uniref:Uncharacterized protein n=1 Tax=Melastoma candidum TaxID=119954 RepID=A0ACB9RN98_9MYRT|nr:hypothetical protein MLD38_006173 [Melastoma candidum]
MGRAPCCDKNNVKRGPWSPEEDAILKSYVETYGTGGNWISLPKKAGLRRCGKSCRLRWLNYLRPDIKHGGFTEEEDEVIYRLYNEIGTRWSVIASRLPGRTDNDVKNYWNTKLKKKLFSSGRMTTMMNPNILSSNFVGSYLTEGSSVPVGLEPQEVMANQTHQFHNKYETYAVLPCYGRTLNNVEQEMCSIISSSSQDHSFTSIPNSSPAITGVDSTSTGSFGGSMGEGGFCADHGMQQVWDFVNELLFEEDETPGFDQPSFPTGNLQSFVNWPMNL